MNVAALKNASQKQFTCFTPTLFQPKGKNGRKTLCYITTCTLTLFEFQCVNESFNTCYCRAQNCSKRKAVGKGRVVSLIT